MSAIINTQSKEQASKFINLTTPIPLSFSQTQYCDSLGLDLPEHCQTFKAATNPWEAMLAQKGIDSKVIYSEDIVNVVAIEFKKDKDFIGMAYKNLNQLTNTCSYLWFSVHNLDLGIGILAPEHPSIKPRRVTNVFKRCFREYRINAVEKLLQTIESSER